MNYSLENFVKPLSDQDKNIQIYNISDIVKWTINPFSITRINVSNNLLVVNLKYNKVVSLDFRTHNEAKDALLKLQAQTDRLIQNVPFSIDKQIQNYVNNIENSDSIIENNYDILVENIWVESNLIPTDLSDALSSPIVASISATTSWISNSYSFKIYSPTKAKITPNNYGDFYQPILLSSVSNDPISATGIPNWKINDDVITFYGGFPSIPVVGPTYPPIIQYFEYTGRTGTFNLISGKTNIIEGISSSNTIPMSSSIRKDNIISVTINGLLIYRWDLISNNLVIDESSLGYDIEPEDLIRIETNIDPGGQFSTQSNI